jgi:hypothetical protein
MLLKNISFGPPFEISIEFWQNLLKIMIFVEKKILNKIMGTSPKIVN